MNDKKNKPEMLMMSKSQDTSELDEFYSVEELRDKLSLDDFISLTKSGDLQNWLCENFFDTEAEELSEGKISKLDDNALLILICKVLEMDVTHLNAEDAQRLESAVNNRPLIDKRRLECDDDGVIVSNQRELTTALKDTNNNKFYLYSNRYNIPLRRESTTYIGRENAVIDIRQKSNDIMDFDSHEIYFQDITVVFHYLQPEQVKIESSANNGNNFIYLNRNKISLNDTVTLKEMADFLSGRTPFETPEEFKTRSENFDPAVVGTVVLNANNYDITKKAFFVDANWEVEFSSLIRDYLGDNPLCIYAEGAEAKALLDNEPAFLVYAEFSAVGDKPCICKLFVRTSSGKRYNINEDLPKTSFSSGSNGAGYGLELINDYEIYTRELMR
ncbi:MAG: hypothetical protein K6G55_05875 [Selenomonadaceae bacterium]|nr:hypothetical protein [Selenomonadaceae bacterium]